MQTGEQQNNQLQGKAGVLQLVLDNEIDKNGPNLSLRYATKKIQNVYAANGE